MSKRFKAKKKLKCGLIIKYLIISVLGYLIIKFSLALVVKFPFFNLTFSTDKITKYKDFIIDNTINKPYKFLKYYKNNNSTNDIQFVNYVVKDRPLIYIYNTHQQEGYKDTKTVLDSALFFKEELNKYKVDTIVEEADISEFMKVNNFDYNHSYYASSFFIKDVIDKYNVDLFIDLHRDAIKRENSIVKINDKVCAKILFVVGGEHKNYKDNYELAKNINNSIIKKYPELSRGVLLKNGEGNNGIYNQDLAKNMILLEIGSHHTTYEEIKNTIVLLAPIIGEYLYGV